MNVNDLTDNKDEILKAEIGSFLFNLGKTHIGIGNWQNYFSNETQLFSSYKNYYEQNYFQNELESINPQLKNFIFDTNITINSETQKWVEYFKGDVSSTKIIKKVFFRGCENVNSGIDKGSPKEQINGILWIANAFGSHIKDVDKNYFDDKRKCFFIVLNEACVTNNWYNTPNWKELRNFILKELKSWYSNLLSDSRFPVNDVTLYDQAYMSATMFKASLAGMFLNTAQSANYISTPQSIKWQILGIQYDKLSLAEKGLKPAHILWYRETSKKVDDKVKKLIETDYALGNEVYRDETGIYFLVPEGIEIFQELKTQILTIFKEKFDDEIYPYIRLTKASRGTMNLTHLLESAKTNFLKADYSLKEKPKAVERPIGICQVCHNQFATKNSDDTPMCQICLERKKGRVDSWLENQEGETIWIGELADKNSRVAMVTLKFELMEWLNGNLLPSQLVRKLENGDTYSNLVNSLKNDFKQVSKKINKTVLKKYMGDILKQSLEDLVKNLFLERSIGSQWEEFIVQQLGNGKINFQARTINFKQLTKDDKELLSKLLLQFLLRKNPSPARLRRVWESTEGFFDEVKNNVLGSIQSIRTKEGFVQKVPDFAYLEPQIDEQDYNQYFSIIDPTPISWQFIIPTEKLECTIDKIQKLYYQNFKYVNGKLPLHIGVVVQNYKKPLYVGIKALRNIRRDVKKWSEISTNEKLKDLSSYFDVKESNNNSQDFYSLYETDNQEYDFSLLPSSKGIKKYNTTDNFTIYPNTIDFEFLDTNSRRNDIFYQKGKRTIDYKTNRPYSWGEWEEFKRFQEQFTNKSNQLQTLVSLIYSKMEDWKDEEDSFKKFMETTFKKEKIELSKFGINDCSFKEITKFLDMFAYYHTTLKEI